MFALLGPKIRNRVHQEGMSWELHMQAQCPPPGQSQDKPLGKRAATRPWFVLNSMHKEQFVHVGTLPSSEAQSGLDKAACEE